MDVEAFWADRAAELEEYARLALRVGVNVEQGQDVDILAYVEHAPLVRAIARVAYAKGAGSFRRTTSTSTSAARRAELAPDDAVGWAPDWMLRRVEEEAERERR